MQLEEKHHSAMQDARAINMAEGLIFPLIDKMISQKTEVMVSEFNGGKKEFIGNAAAISALYELKQILKSKQLQGNSILERINNENTGA